MTVSNQKGRLFIVATPIGNLGDMTPRAQQVLAAVAVIAAEDTRHSAALMSHFGIATPLLSLHEHNERQKSAALLARLAAGEDIALISDAGTPLISDPGYYLVREAHREGIAVIPIPGPSALTAALCASGLPTDRFLFQGFLPAKSGARRKLLEELTAEPMTLIFYESTHRIVASLADMADILGPERPATLARELTKTFETIHHAPLGELFEWVQADPNQQKGEFVLMVQGCERGADSGLEEGERIAAILAEELPTKQAAALAARISGVKKNLLYQYLLAQRGENQ